MVDNCSWMAKGGDFAYCTVPQARPFRRGQELGRGDLTLLVVGPVRLVTYFVYHPFERMPLGVDVLGAYAWFFRDRVPVNPAREGSIREYYPAFRIPEIAVSGEYQIRWKVLLENGEVRKPVHSFWVG